MKLKARLTALGDVSLQSPPPLLCSFICQILLNAFLYVFIWWEML